jgi:hypothetical protein
MFFDGVVRHPDGWLWCVINRAKFVASFQQIDKTV